MENSKFKKIESKEFDGDFVMCVNCNETLDISEQKNHVCPLTFEQKVSFDLIKLLDDESVGIKEKIGALSFYMNDVKKKEKKEVEKIEKQLNYNVLRKLVYNAILEHIERIRHYREQEYIQNDQRRAEGMGFAERMELINKKKIDWCDKKEKELLRDINSFNVRPVSEWLSVVDIENAKSRGEGIKYIIKNNLEQIYVPNK